MRVKRNICLSFMKLASHPSSAHVSMGFAFFFSLSDISCGPFCESLSTSRVGEGVWMVYLNFCNYRKSLTLSHKQRWWKKK